MKDLASRSKWPVRAPFMEAKPIIRISTDGFVSYPPAIESCFGPWAAYAQIIKKVVKKQLTIEKEVITGDIDLDDISTSLVERSNLTTRTFMRRFMRKSLGFSKKLENLRAAVAMHMTNYNYCWLHKKFKDTAARGHRGQTETFYF